MSILPDLFAYCHHWITSSTCPNTFRAQSLPRDQTFQGWEWAAVPLHWIKQPPPS
jgi:hypothetical protein